MTSSLATRHFEMSWCCLQLGSREHYAVPVALHRVGALGCLITDTWLSRPVSSLVRPLSPALAARRHATLPDALVRRRSVGRVTLDLQMRMQGKKGWDATMTRNDWFGRWAAREVERSGARTVFSYSYTARLPFRYAEGRDVLRVLGQIDPGPREQDVVKEYAADYLALAPPEDLIPSKYWNLWREEVDAADKIVVNSAWSARLLAEAGVPAQKMMEIPLVYEPVNLAVGSLQSSVFSVSRSRLRALFLGSVILRKGVGQLFDAISLLKNEPVDFTFAGPIGVMIPDDVLRMPNVRFLGAVDKATAEALYRESDLFLFPTLSDGFGLTQLEALGHGLPVIASTHCGQVVEHGVTGLLLAEVTPDAVAETTMALVRDRDLLAMLKSGARMPDKFHPRHLAPALLRLVSGAV